MDNFLGKGGSGGERTREAMKFLFRRVFATADGRLVIEELRRRIPANPKSDMECAKVVGMHAVIDAIFDISDFFGD